MLKSYSEGPFHHEDKTMDINRQTADLKREVCSTQLDLCHHMHLCVDWREGRRVYIEEGINFFR